MDFLTLLGFSGIVLSLLAATAKAVASAPRTFLDAAQRDGRFAASNATAPATEANSPANDTPRRAA